MSNNIDKRQESIDHEALLQALSNVLGQHYQIVHHPNLKGIHIDCYLAGLQSLLANQRLVLRSLEMMAPAAGITQLVLPKPNAGEMVTKC